MTKFVSPSESLYWKRTLGRDEYTKFLTRKIRPEEFVERLKHQRRTELGYCAEHVDATTTGSLDLLFYAKITMQRMCSLGTS